MATIVATHINPFAFTVEGEVADDGAITADLTPAGIASEAGALLAEDNLADLDDADAALTNLGGTATGVAVFTAANTPAAQSAIGAGTAGSAIFIAASTDDAQTALGVSTVGKNVIVAEDEGAARDAIGVSNIVPLVASIPDIISASAVVVSVVAPFDCAIVGADLWASTTIAVGSLTATMAINGVAVTNGVMTLASGAASGTLGPCTPTAANEAVGRQGVIRVTIGGGNTAAGRGTVTILVVPAVLA